MTRPNSKALSRAEVKEMMREVKASARDERMSKRCLCDVYKLPSGSALLVLADGTGRVYGSYHDFEAFLDDNSAAKVFQELLPQQKYFVDDVAALVSKLPRLIGVDASYLDLSERSLRVVDEALRQFDESRILSAELFPSVLAYVGEVVRRGIDGEWQVLQQADGTWEPDIVDKRGNRCGLLRIYKELMEYQREASLTAFAYVTIRSSNRF